MTKFSYLFFIIFEDVNQEIATVQIRDQILDSFPQENVASYSDEYEHLLTHGDTYVWLNQE